MTNKTETWGEPLGPRKAAMTERHDYWEDPFVGVDLCGECGCAREARIHRPDFVPKPPAPVKPAGVRGQPSAAGCGALLAGLGLFVAGVGFGALYLVAVIREVF